MSVGVENSKRVERCFLCGKSEKCFDYLNEELAFCVDRELLLGDD
jgi:hypothetical protein